MGDSGRIVVRELDLSQVSFDDGGAHKSTQHPGQESVRCKSIQARRDEKADLCQV